MAQDVAPQFEQVLEAQVKMWRSEKEAMLAERATLTARLEEIARLSEELDHKIHAAKILLPSLSGPEPEDGDAQEETLTGAILTVLKPFPNGRSRQGIQNRLPPAAREKAAKTPNYLQIALKRLVERGLIVDIAPQRYRLTPKGRGDK